MTTQNQDGASHTQLLSESITITSTAKTEYQRRLQQRESAVAQLQRKHLWLGNTRIAVFVAIVAFAWFSRNHSLLFYLLIAAIILFIALVVVHRRVVRAMNMAKRAAAVYRRGIARFEDRWTGTGEAGDEFKDPLHPYAEDLDILGQGSLFQLLCTARTRKGKAYLAQWLLMPAGPPEIPQRQTAIAELKRKLDLREDLAVMGESERIDAHPFPLAQWAQEQSGLKDGRWWALLLGALGIVTLVYAFTKLWTPFIVLLLINGGITFRLRHHLEKVFAGLAQTHKDLDSLAEILRRIEVEKFESPWLQQLRARLITHGHTPSQCIAQLDTLTDLEDSRHNWFVRLFDVPLLYSLQLAFALDRWRRNYGSGVPVWLDVVGEVETLAGLGSYAFEHEHDPFPEFLPSGNSPIFEGEALGHPLLPAAQCVRNDATLGGRNQVLLVSGSNMSGKSTYLRVVGINAVLAMMGAPVRASSLRLSYMAIAASMRVSDSLQHGISHFYAEIKRVRQVIDISASQPTLFLLDEILQGTNSRDRRIGTEGILRSLLRNSAIGLVTTHDLALTSLEEVFPDQVRNGHFQEKFEDDKLSFDYRLRPGIVTTSNGIELMRSIGLDIS
ncbi:MAG TPA: mismatch repair protein [Candidatus Sulfotelmatobacter sp.]|nr:mismatch repair protein [Candidatus Sulfotelmatobacter sp.]